MQGDLLSVPPRLSWPNGVGAPALASQSPQPAFERICLGLCEDYPRAARSLDHARRDLRAAQAAGVRVLRVGIAWDTLEPEPGVYDWTFWDAFMRMATEECHLRLIPYVAYTPCWCSASPGNDVYWRSPPKDPEAYTRVLAQLAARYAEVVPSWELWNEPDNPDFWLGTPQEYAQIMRAGALGVRRGSSHASVVLGGLARDLTYLQTLLVNQQIADVVDVINLHAYCETWTSEGLEQLADYLLRASDLIDQHGGGQRLWLAEVGYSDRRHAGHISPYYAARYGYEHTREFQADALFRMQTLALATRKVDLIAWYRINDLGADTPVIGDDNNRYLGVLTVDGQPKPAYHALEFFTRLFQRPVRGLDHAVRMTRAVSSTVRMHAFERADGVRIAVCWLEHAAPGRGRRSPAGDELGPAAESVRLEFPISASGATCTRFDAQGRPRGRVVMRQAHRAWHIQDLMIAAGETAVLVIEPDELRPMENNS